jgi:2-oxoglutarate ferredoxin oxidoreductase subunit alpha
MFGRNGDSPIPIIAPATPGDCFDTAIEAFRLRFMPCRRS